MEAPSDSDQFIQGETGLFIGKCNFTAGAAPTVNDDETEGYSENSVWYKASVPYRLWKCTDNTAGAAVWREILLVSSFTLSDITGVLAINKGGTGQTTANAGFGALSPLTTKGDVLGFSTVNARLGVGSNNQVLTADSAQTTGLKWDNPLTSGRAFSGGGANRILFLDASQNLATNSGFTFNTVAGIFNAEAVITSGFSAGSGEIRSYQTGGFFVAVKTDAGTNKSGLFRSNTDFFVYYDTSTGRTVLDATYSGDAQIYFDILGVNKARLDSSGNFGIGTAPSAKFHVVSNTEQARFGYDGSNYWNSTTNNVGATTFNAVGSGAKFTFSDKVVARLEKRVNSQASVATLTPNADSYDAEKLTAQAANLTIANPSGTPTDEQEMIIKVTSTGIYTFTFGTSYQGNAAQALPAGMTGGIKYRMKFVYDADSTSWDLVEYAEI